MQGKSLDSFALFAEGKSLDSVALLAEVNLFLHRSAVGVTELSENKVEEANSNS